MNSTLRTLYVEDNAINRLVLEKMLAKNCQIETEENGYQGIERALENPYDVYILDLNLGLADLDGFGVLERIKPEQPKALYVALTAYVGEEWEEKCLEAGFDLYYGKPVEANKLWQEIIEFKSRRESNT